MVNFFFFAGTAGPRTDEASVPMMIAVAEFRPAWIRALVRRAAEATAIAMAATLTALLLNVRIILSAFSTTRSSAAGEQRCPHRPPAGVGSSSLILRTRQGD